KQHYLLIPFYISLFLMTRKIQSTKQSIFLNSKITHNLNSNLPRYFKFKTLQQTPLVLNSKNMSSIISYKSNSLVDN
ncbi:hypothetical protein, partial [Acinetobacter pittii]|uniref:hypothetical protein n=1 Tax=Acinetobacter pittii TaxID=48296 RepID=UPI003B42FD37